MLLSKVDLKTQFENFQVLCLRLNLPLSLQQYHKRKQADVAASRILLFTAANAPITEDNKQPLPVTFISKGSPFVTRFVPLLFEMTSISPVITTVLLKSSEALLANCVTSPSPERASTPLISHCSPLNEQSQLCSLLKQ